MNGLRFALGCFLSITVSIRTSSAQGSQRFSTNDRNAVVLDAFYALNQKHDGTCGQSTSDGKCVSNWNFLSSDLNSYTYMKEQYGCNASDWAVALDRCPNDTKVYRTVPSFYSDLTDFGLSAAGGLYGQVGRGAQCVYFANLILYRSGADPAQIFNIAVMAKSQNIDTNLQDTVEGDVLQVYGDSAPGFEDHVTIATQVYRSHGAVVALDVIDSNFVTDLYYQSGGKVGEREMIALHHFCVATDSSCPFLNQIGVLNVQGHYHIYTKTAYYHAPYIPDANPPSGFTVLIK